MDINGHLTLADSPDVVRTENLSKRFGSRTVVDAADLVVPRGCAFGFLGPNGAGKRLSSACS
jgi:ABC-type multidrug transport system ATPase subunit